MNCYKAHFSKKRISNTGFTLVELIVVLVILAILAAILIPALLGYIDDAKDKKDLFNAKNCLNAIQSEMSKLYAKTSDNLKTDSYKNNNFNYLLGETTSNDSGRDVNAINTDFSNKVISKLDVQPYVILFAAGAYDSNTGVTKHEAYTVCYLFYQEKSDSMPLYYYNGEWSRNHPRFYKDTNGRQMEKDDIIVKGSNNTMNKMQVGKMTGKCIQYYLIKYGNNTRYNDLWTYMKNIAYKFASF